MAKLVDLDGNEFEFEPLKYDEKNLIKVRLVSDDEDNTPEGIWAVVSPQDKIKHDNDDSEGRFICMLANDALCMYPNRSWGLHIVAEFRGEDRPEANRDWVNYLEENNRIMSPDCTAE